MLGWYVVAVSVVLVATTVSSATVRVGENETVAYYRLGEFEGMLDEGRHVVTPFVSQFYRHEQSPEPQMTETVETTDGDRVEVTVRLDFELGDIERGYERDNVENPLFDLRATASELLRSELGTRDTETALSAHVDIERTLDRELRQAARERYMYLQNVTTLSITRVDQPTATGN